MRAVIVRRLSLGAASVAAVVMMGSAVAWACSPGAALQSIDLGSSRGAPGSVIRVVGDGFYSGLAVQIRWDSITAVPLAETKGPEFSVPVRVPATASPGPHQIFLTFVYDGVKQERSQGFEVPAVNTSVTREASASNSSSGAEADVAPSGAGAGPTPAGPTPADSAPAGGQAGAGPSSGASPAQSTSGPSAAAVPPALRTLPASSNPGAVRAPSGRVVFGGSVIPDSAATPSAQPAIGTDEAPAVAQGAASADLWSGFQSDATPIRGLNGPASAPAGPGSTAVSLALLVGAGLVALLSGFGLAELQRRRAPVSAGR